MQVCYIIVGKGWDHYARMAWLSATSVRIQDPSMRIVLVVEATPAAVEELTARFDGLADSFLVRTSDVAEPVSKSRHHRMRLFEYLQGDVAYVDSDTLAIQPVTAMFDAPGDVCGALDFNHDVSKAFFPPGFRGPFEALGWQYPLPYYMNAGILLLRDTPQVRAFCDEWHARWCALMAMKGHPTSPANLPHVADQVSFNSALWASGVPHAILDKGFNAMVVKREYRFRQSQLLHFFGSADEQRGTVFEHLLRHLERTGEFDRAAYDRCLLEGHPWGADPEPWQLIHSRNYVRAVGAKARRFLRR